MIPSFLNRNFMPYILNIAGRSLANGLILERVNLLLTKQNELVTKHKFEVVSK